MKQLDATLREPGDRRIRPPEDLLTGTGQLNLSTSYGPLDLLCRLHDGRGYADLIGLTEVVTDGEVEIRVLDLATLIDVKSSTGRAKDKLSLPILVALLRERESEGE
ncbi:MAG: hypothetical protein RL885_19550 [Planctomycetota bacterium]